MQKLVDDSEDFDALRGTIRDLEEQRVARNTELEARRARVVAVTDVVEQIQSKQKEIAVRISDFEKDRNDFNEFLVLARNHVTGDSCPLCEQKIDPQRIVARLEERIAEIPVAIRQLNEQRRELQDKAADAEANLAELRPQEQLLVRQISEVASSIREATRRISSWTDQAARLGADEGNPEQIASRLQQQADLTSSLVELRERSDEIRVQAQYLAARDRLTKLTEEEGSASVESERLRQELSKLKEAQARLSSIVQVAKQSEQEIVAQLLSRQEPLLNALYQSSVPIPFWIS